MFLSSPERPISAAKQTPLGTEIFILLDNIAAITAKSIAGSSIFIPPVIFKKTSFVPKLNLAFFSKTAYNILSLLELNPVVLL